MVNDLTNPGNSNDEGNNNTDRSWIKTALILFSGQLASLLGSGLVQFAIIWSLCAPIPVSP